MTDPSTSAAQESAYAVLVDTVRDAQGRRLGADMDTELLAALAWACVHGASVLARDRQYDGRWPDPEASATDSPMRWCRSGAAPQHQ